MKISYVIIAHQNPIQLIRLLTTIVAAGYTVALHYDKRASDKDFQTIQAAFADNPSVRLARRVKVRWGEWSICEATLNCLEEIAASGWEPDYVYYASGSDYPIRSSEELSAFLTRNRGKEFIEGVPANKERWVKGGPQKERYQYNFWFNWRDQHRRASFFLKWQIKFGLKRKFVLGLEPYIGAQWWVLTWETLKRVLEFTARKGVVKFFKTTLIPDELFFQTLVCNLVPASRIVARPLTLYQFTDYMVPVIFCADRVDYLIRQPFFMARKVSPHRAEMYDRLDEVWLDKGKTLPFKDEEIGTISPEYETYRLKYRDGASGLPLYGKQPDNRSGDLARLEETFFAVLGLSTSELKIAHTLLSCAIKLICHGQIFHQNSLEFAGDADEFAGYHRNYVKLRNTSVPNFVANLVRAEPDKTTGFLLRSGQGSHVPEILFTLPKPRVLLLLGDPIIAFAESICGGDLTLHERIDWNMINAVPPSVLARKWNEFYSEFQEKLEQFDQLVNTGMEKKPLDSWTWLTEVDLDLSHPSRLRSESTVRFRSDLDGWAGITWSRWRDWVVAAEKNLGVPLLGLISPDIFRAVTTTLAGLETGRKVTISALAAGGIALPADYDPTNVSELFPSSLLLNKVR